MSEMTHDEKAKVPAYIGYCPQCGAHHMCVVDDGQYPKMVANAVASCVRIGDIVERTTVGWVWENFKWASCDCNNTKKHKGKKQAAQVVETGQEALL